MEIFRLVNFNLFLRHFGEKKTRRFHWNQEPSFTLIIIIRTLSFSLEACLKSSLKASLHCWSPLMISPGSLPLFRGGRVGACAKTGGSLRHHERLLKEEVTR